MMKQRGIGGIDMALWLAALMGCMTFFSFYLLAARRKLAPQTKIKARMLRLNRAESAADQVRIDSEHLNLPFVERIIYPLLTRAEQHLIKLAPDHIAEMLRIRIMKAGKQRLWRVNGFVCFWVLSTVAFAGVAAFFTVYVMHFIILQVMAIVLGMSFIGGALPLMFLDSLIAKRQKNMRQQLPEVLDLICVSMQAGLSFDGAMAKAVEKMRGDFIDECNKMLQDVRMGMTRQQALKQLSLRCGLQEVQLFTAAVIQAERLGVSLSKTLEIQSENMRERHRQKLKAQALKAPVKIIAPLVLFIFPTLFIVVLAPMVLIVMKSSGGWGR